MMKRLKYLTLATLVAFAACDEGADPVDEPVTGSVTVSASAEGENVDGATVTLTGEGTSQSQTTSGGTATFSNVVEGSYVVSLSGIPSDYVFGNTTQTTNVTPGQPDATVSFTGSIVRTASISGQVTAGVGLEGIQVEISGGGDGITETKQTDAGGTYAFTGLRSGEYTITISGFDEDDFDFPSTTANVSLEPGESEVVNFSGSGSAAAEISIQSITQAGGPINLSNVAGQIEVTINLDRGGQTVEEIDVLVDGEVVATQVLTPPGEAQAVQAIETLTLNVATDQIEMAENGWVPVIFNGGAFISAHAWVSGETSPIPSNEVPVVMNNPDKVLLVDDVLTPDTPEPSITIDGDTWMTGGAAFTGLNYLAYSGVMPDDVTWTTEAGICDATGTLTGTPTTGIVVENAFDCAGEEGPVRPDAAAIDVDTELDGPDGTPVTPAGEDDYVRRGAEFSLGHEPGDPDIETRHFIVMRDADFDELLLDNLGPTVCIDGEGSIPEPNEPTAACAVFETAAFGEIAVDTLRVAFRDNFDEWWINAEHNFRAEGDLHVTDGGVGFGDVDFDTDDIEAGDDMSDLWAQHWLPRDMPDPEDGTCSGDRVDVGGDLDETITSDATDGHLLCGAATDALGNVGTGAQPSNYLGADFLPPEIRLAGSTDDADLIVAPTEATEPVSEDPDATIYNIDGDGEGLGPFPTDAQWGIETIDDRAGFDQNLAYFDYDGDHFPVYQQLLAVDNDGWAEDANETHSCDAFNADDLDAGVSDGDNGLMDPGLADDFQRSVLSPDLVCAQAVPRYFRYLGWVVDRAGNFSEMLEYNFLVDQDMAATTSAVGFGATIYTVGEDAPFAVFGEDDLEVISAELSLQYPSTEEADALRLNFGSFDFPGFERWGDLYSDEDDVDALITEAVTGQDVILPGDMVLGRIDWTEVGDGLPAEAGGDLDGDLTDEFNDQLAVGAEADEFLANAVTASLIDAGMNQGADTAIQNFIPAQWGGGVPAPWLGVVDDDDVAPLAGDTTFISWALEQDGDGNVVARHRASSSVIEPIFEEVWLVLNLNDGDGLADGLEDTLIVCNMVSTPRIQDTGLRRIYLYDLFEIPLDDDDMVDLDPDDVCETPPAGATFHGFGILEDAALATQPYTFMVP